MYRISVTETLKRVVEVPNAKTLTEAVKEAQKMYANCEIILNYSDLVDTEFKVEV